jgi:hypothetical protein
MGIVLMIKQPEEIHEYVKLQNNKCQRSNGKKRVGAY